MPSYLQAVPGGFFFRMVVPKALRPKLQKTELKKFIRGPRSIAEKTAMVYAAGCFELFESLREKTMADFPFTRINIVADLTPKALELKKLEMDPDKEEAEIRMMNAVFDRLERLKLKFAEETPVQDVPAASIDAPIAKPSAGVKGMLLSEAVDRFMVARKKRSDKRGSIFDEGAARDPFELLSEFLRCDPPIESITLEQAEEFQTLLKSIPRVRTTKLRRNLDFYQLLALKETDTASDNTQGQHIGKISGLWRWLADSQILIIENPFFKLADKKVMHREAAVRRKQAFDSTDLKKIFSHQIFTEGAYKEDWEYWLPLLLLLSGCRVNEIIQLEKKDIFQVDGIWCLSINDVVTREESEIIWDGTKKRVKNSNSRREIPIHSHLIELGFLDFTDKKRSGRIFPDIKPISRKLAKTPCRRFNEELLVEMGVKVKSKKTLYSFRHTTMNSLKIQRISIEDRAQLAGHAQSTSTSTYGDEFPLQDMQKLIESLKFGDVLDAVGKF